MNFTLVAIFAFFPYANFFQGRHSIAALRIEGEVVSFSDIFFFFFFFQIIS